MARFRSALGHLHEAPALLMHHQAAGYCLENARYEFNIPAKYRTAWLSWQGAGGSAGANTHTNPANAPADVPVFWSGGHDGAGHVAISAGGGYCYTTDWNGQSAVWTKVKISDIAKRWGLHYLGWSETLNGVRVHAHVTYDGKGWS